MYVAPLAIRALPCRVCHLLTPAPPPSCNPQNTQVSQKLQLIAQGKWVDETPEERRSPSPEPLYNETGARTNTREARARDKLVRLRNVSACFFGGRGCRGWMIAAAGLAQRQVMRLCNVFASRAGKGGGPEVTAAAGLAAGLAAAAAAAAIFVMHHGCAGGT